MDEKLAISSCRQDEFRKCPRSSVRFVSHIKTAHSKEVIAHGCLSQKNRNAQSKNQKSTEDFYSSLRNVLPCKLQSTFLRYSNISGDHLFCLLLLHRRSGAKPWKSGFRRFLIAVIVIHDRCGQTNTESPGGGPRGPASPAQPARAALRVGANSLRWIPLNVSAPGYRHGPRQPLSLSRLPGY